MEELDIQIKAAFEKVREIHPLEVNMLMGKYQYSVGDVLDAWKSWDIPKGVINSDYNNSLIRLIMHFHNRYPNLWHQKRQEKILEYIHKLKPKNICDIGFGTPQLYVEKFSIPNNTNTLLCHIDTDGFDFSQSLVKHLAGSQEYSVDFAQFDMNIDLLPSGFDCYLFQDSIEHAINPTHTLKTYVDQVSVNTTFIFSLPLEIENPIPQHHICWGSEREIEDWLNQSGLTIHSSHSISMGEEDIFARSLHKDFKEVVFLCQK